MPCGSAPESVGPRYRSARTSRSRERGARDGRVRRAAETHLRVSRGLGVCHVRGSLCASGNITRPPAELSSVSLKRNLCHHSLRESHRWAARRVPGYVTALHRLDAGKGNICISKGALVCFFEPNSLAIAPGSPAFPRGAPHARAHSLATPWRSRCPPSARSPRRARPRPGRAGR